MARTKAKVKKDIVKVNYSMDRSVADALEEFCDRTARTKTKVVELAIMEYIERHTNEK